MNLKKLKEAEDSFLLQYPGGFEDPKMLAISKRHKMDKMISFVQESFSENSFSNSELIIENLVKTVSRSSMVSMFEKPKFRDHVNSLILEDQEILVMGLKEILHGKKERGFEMMLDVLRPGKLAKWSLITTCPIYYYPKKEVFVKPTTAKGVIDFFELKSLQYKPAPTWAFYSEFRKIINEMKSKVNSSLSPNNAAFTGFLMMSLE